MALRWVEVLTLGCTRECRGELFPFSTSDVIWAWWGGGEGLSPPLLSPLPFSLSPSVFIPFVLHKDEEELDITRGDARIDQTCRIRLTQSKQVSDSFFSLMNCGVGAHKAPPTGDHPAQGGTSTSQPPSRGGAVEVARHPPQAA